MASRNKKIRRVVLVYGEPGNGKSYLANQLNTQHGYHVVSTDEAYVAFIRETYPQIDFPLLRQFIKQHFLVIVPGASHILGQNIVQAWVDHLCQVTKNKSSQHMRLAVKGYLVSPALDGLEDTLRAVATVVKVEVRGRNYFIADSLDAIHSWSEA